METAPHVWSAKNQDQTMREGGKVRSSRLNPCGFGSFFFFPFPPKSSLWTHSSMIPSFPYCFHQMTLIVRMVMLCACVFWRKGQDLCHTTAIFGISYFSIQNAPKGHYVVLKNKVKLNFNIKNKDFFFFSSLTEEQAFLRGK